MSKRLVGGKEPGQKRGLPGLPCRGLDDSLGPTWRSVASQEPGGSLHRGPGGSLRGAPIRRGEPDDLAGESRDEPRRRYPQEVGNLQVEPHL